MLTYILLIYNLSIQHLFYVNIFRLKRQTAIDWSTTIDDFHIRKSKSLPDTCNNEHSLWNNDNNNIKKTDNGKLEKKKNKKHNKIVRKSKTDVL